MLLSTRRVWIEISSSCLQAEGVPLVTLHTESMDWNSPVDIKGTPHTIGYSPHGEYGLKSFMSTGLNSDTLLLSTRRVWIEITHIISPCCILLSYSPHGEYGLKFAYAVIHTPHWNSYSPHGEYGLKFVSLKLYIFWYCYSPHGEYGLKS